jgi:hypothetical protein
MSSNFRAVGMNVAYLHKSGEGYRQHAQQGQHPESV